MLENITKFFAELPNDIKKEVMNILVAGAMATNKIENNITRLDKNAISSYEQPYSTGNHFKDMLSGVNSEAVKEYVKRYYQILEKSDDYDRDIDGNLKSSELYQQNYKQKLNESSDNSDFNNLEYVVTNKRMLLENNIIGESPNIIVKRDVPKKYNIEDYTDSVHVKSIDKNYKAIEFYLFIDKTNHLYKSVISQEYFFSDFDYLTLIKTKYRDTIKNYEIIKHHSLSTFRNNIVIKYIGREV